MEPAEMLGAAMGRIWASGRAYQFPDDDTCNIDHVRPAGSLKARSGNVLCQLASHCLHQAAGAGVWPIDCECAESHA
jgi:hypothetical protein